jgi:hypothetical protein
MIRWVLAIFMVLQTFLWVKGEVRYRAGLAKGERAWKARICTGICWGSMSLGR